MSEYRSTRAFLRQENNHDAWETSAAYARIARLSIQLEAARAALARIDKLPWTQAEAAIVVASGIARTTLAAIDAMKGTAP